MWPTALVLSRIEANASTTILNKNGEKGSPYLTPHRVGEIRAYLSTNVNRGAPGREDLHDPGNPAIIKPSPEQYVPKEGTTNSVIDLVEVDL